MARAMPVLGTLLALFAAGLGLGLVLLWLAFWTTAAAVLAVFRWIVEGAAAITAGLLWMGGGVYRLAHRLTDRFSGGAYR